MTFLSQSSANPSLPIRPAVERLLGLAGVPGVDAATVAAAATSQPGAGSAVVSGSVVGIAWEWSSRSEPVSSGVGGDDHRGLAARARQIRERAAMTSASSQCFRSSAVLGAMSDAGFDDPEGATSALGEAMQASRRRAAKAAPAILEHALTDGERTIAIAVLALSEVRSSLVDPEARQALVGAYHRALGIRARSALEAGRANVAIGLLDEAASVGKLPLRLRFLEVGASHALGQDSRALAGIEAVLATPRSTAGALDGPELSELHAIAVELGSDRLASEAYAAALEAFGANGDAGARIDELLPNDARAGDSQSRGAGASPPSARNARDPDQRSSRP